MKNLMMILGVTLALVACQQSVDVEKETEAIKALIEKSANAWTVRDYQDMKDVWANAESDLRINATSSAYSIMQSWEDLDARYEQYFADNPDPDAWREIFLNYRMKIYTENAVVLADRYHVTNEGDTLRKTLHDYHLEKLGSEWKISSLTTIMLYTYDQEDKNLETSEAYHLLNPANFDDILTDDFIGRDEIGGTWNKERHRAAWSNNTLNATDSIIYQAANDDVVTTRFLRKGEINGEKLAGEALQVKRFEGDKIAEIWEYGFGVFKQ